jgi:uncharacterized protein
MFSLKKLFSKEDKFFTLLQASAHEGRVGVASLRRLLGSPGASSGLQDLVAARDKERQIAEEIDQLLCESYATPLEREDIETLARALYRVPKTLKKFAERYLLSTAHIGDVNFSQHVEMLETATETVYQMVADLKKGAHLNTTKANNDILQKVEGEADKLLVAELERLYHGGHNIVRVVILKDLYELLERAFDRCRNAGNIMFQIVLKNS